MKLSPKNLLPLFVALLFNTVSPSSGISITGENANLLPKLTPKVASVELYYDSSVAPIAFAAEHLAGVLKSKGTAATLKPIEELGKRSQGKYIVLVEGGGGARSLLADAGGKSVGDLDLQDYALRKTGRGADTGYWAIGGDRRGAMYGGIHIAEIVSAGSLADVDDEDQSPYIESRGLKFNIPLDSRSPSFDDGGAAAGTNRDDVWDLDFWKEYFDVLALQRYNTLSLWNRHPFPSLVKVPGYEDIALDEVLGQNDEVIVDWTIEEKIEFWNQVLDLAEDRCIEVWFMLWNVELQSAEGQYGITKDKDNRTTIDYLRKSTYQYFINYPKMAGLGITAGEKMDNFTDIEKEQWVWDAYGEGVMDVKKEFPDRNIRFVHRIWLTDYAPIEPLFGQLPDGFELATKYAQARLYSHTAPTWASKQLSDIPEDRETWWNLRNDDIFVQRWGDPDYVKDYILNFPHESKPCEKPPCLTAGYIMGSDRYLWARESMSKNPQTPRQLENQKHWYKFLLWGRLGYDPHTPHSLLKGLISYRFSGVDGGQLFDAWSAASKVIPVVNQFHFWAWDYFWYVERGTGNEWSDIDGYHNIDHVIENKVQDESGFLSIKDFVHGDTSGTSPLIVASQLETNAKVALTALSDMSDNGNVELAETIGDIRSQAHFGLYWSHKIRGGVELERFRQTKDVAHKRKAVSHLEKALVEWKHYADQLGASYQKVRIAGHHIFDWDALTPDVANDIYIALQAE